MHTKRFGRKFTGHFGRGLVRVGRSRTTAITTVFDVEQVYAATILPGQNDPGNFTAFNRFLPFQIVNGGGNQAANLVLRFTLSDLTQAATNYVSIGNLYDFIKVNSCTVKLVSPVDPRKDVTYAGQNTAGGGTIQDFGGALVYDPNISLVDYDGIHLITSVPANGDITSQVYGRFGARRHRQFGSITHTLFPRTLMACAGAPTGGNPPGSSADYQLGPNGWQRRTNGNIHLGFMLIAFAYCGPDNLSVGIQPVLNWGLQVKWNVSMKSPLYG